MPKRNRISDCDVIIAAAGSSTRFKGRTKKQFYIVNGKPIIIHTILNMLKVFRPENIIVVSSEKGISKMRTLLYKEGMNGIRIVKGGEERAVSVYNGVLESRRKYVLVHDGARPYVPIKVINRIINTKISDKSCTVPFLCPKETVRIEEKSGLKTLDRRQIRLIQTPQMFTRNSLEYFMKISIKKKEYFTDEAEYIIKNGGKISFVEGDVKNIKITTAEDAEIIKMIMKAEK